MEQKTRTDTHPCDEGMLIAGVDLACVGLSIRCASCGTFRGTVTEYEWQRWCPTTSIMLAPRPTETELVRIRSLGRAISCFSIDRGDSGRLLGVAGSEL